MEIDPLPSPHTPPQNHTNACQLLTEMQISILIVVTSLGGIHGVLFAASIATSLINLGLDILLKVKGCSIFYPSIKRNTKKYNYLAKQVAEQMRLMNVDWKRGKRSEKVDIESDSNWLVFIVIPSTIDFESITIVDFYRFKISIGFNVHNDFYRIMVIKHYLVLKAFSSTTIFLYIRQY